MSPIAFFDIEVSSTGKQLLDIGCILIDDSVFHKNQPKEFENFVENSNFICGHNILLRDLAYLQKNFGNAALGLERAIDTFPSVILQIQ